MSHDPAKKFLIITSETGGGHASAASAIADGLRRFAAPECLVNIARALEESHLLAEKLAELYNYLLRNHQHLMKYYYWAIEHLHPNESNCYYPSLAFNPKHLIQIKKLERQLKKSHAAETQPALEPHAV